MLFLPASPQKYVDSQADQLVQVVSEFTAHHSLHVGLDLPLIVLEAGLPLVELLNYVANSAP